MTGRELIVYILTNNLEDEPIFKDGRFVGFITASEAALKMNVGVATVHAWAALGRIPSILVAKQVYIPVNFEILLKTEEKHE